MSRLTRISNSIATCTGLSPFIVNLSRLFQFIKFNHWAFPSSLVTTKGISFDFFSSGYLDISVLRVRFFNLCIQLKIPLAWWVSPFRYFRIKAYWQLPETFRSLLRLSSPLIAKASTRCPLYTYCYMF